MKKIGIGYENYKEFIDNDLYYVDKTLLVRDIINNGGKVTLFTRPRRFGKTLAMSMLRTYFEQVYDKEGNIIDNSRYFEGMQIANADEDILTKMGQYPVIKLSLKSAKQPDFYSSFIKLRDEIIGEFARHSYLKKMMNGDAKRIAEFESYEYGVSNWAEKEALIKEKDERESAIKIEYAKYSTAIKTLADFLKEYQGQNVIILIDEYDVPLENAYQEGFYDEMVAYIRSLFESAFKTNDSLEYAVVSGCLRISKESIFTGLNNLKVNSILSADFSEGFGFNESEVKEMLKAYQLEDRYTEVKEWYDGYLFGVSEVYNPWSVICYVDSKVNGMREFPIPFWSNTSSNSIIKDMVENADDTVKADLDTLISGGTIEKRIHEDITYWDIDKSDANLWNFLFFTGYLKKVSERLQNEDVYISMKIPNAEVMSIYRHQIQDWFDRKIKEKDFSALYKAIAEMDCQGIEDFINELLSKSISYFDSEESFYHGFLLSLLYGMKNYAPKSNREEGNGRPDIILYPERPRDAAFIFELKVRKKFNEMEEGLKAAFNQIRTKKYENGILQEGYTGVVSYGICFCKKSCIVGVMNN